MTIARSASLVGAIAALLAATCVPWAAVDARVRGAGACATAGKNTPKGTIRFSDVQFPTTLNTNQTDTGSAYLTDQLQNDSLVRYDNTGHLYPVLLSRVPSRKNGGISRDGKTIRLTLKHGLRWSNGAEITAHQIWFAWKIGMDRLSGPACLGTCDKIASISTPGKYVAVIHMKKLYASAVPRALPGIMIEAWKSPVGTWARDQYHQAAYALYQEPSFSFAGPNYPTTGPYKVTGFKAFSHITLTPNPYYSDMSCGAHLAKITFRWYSTKQQMIAAAAKHQTDVTVGYQPSDLPALRRSARHYTIYDVPGFAYEHLELNVDPTYAGKPNPLSNEKVRQALALAIDKVAAIKQSLGVDGATARKIAAYNPWVWRPGLREPYADPSITGQWDPRAGKYVQAGSPQAVRDAKQLLKGTPWKKGFTLDAVTTDLQARQNLLKAAASSWSKLGVTVTIAPEPDDLLFGNWVENGTLAHGKFQIALFTWVGSPDPDSWVNEMGSAYVDRKDRSHSDLNQNYAGFDDRIIDRGFRIGSGTFDGTKRAQAYRAVQREMNHQAYWIGIYYRDQISTSDGKVKHFIPNPTSAGVTWNGYDWST